MSANHTPTQEVLTMAARCAGCADGACMKACPEEVNLRALFEFVAAQAQSPIIWRQDEREANDFVIEAIEKSFTPWVH